MATIKQSTLRPGLQRLLQVVGHLLGDGARGWEMGEHGAFSEQKSGKSSRYASVWQIIQEAS